MNRLPSLLIVTTLTASLWPGYSPSIQAANWPSQTTSHSNAVLTANRLGRYGFRRFRARASGYRRGGFARGSCPKQEAFVPIVPVIESTSNRDTADSGDVPQAPAYLTASAHPVFFVNLPQLPVTQGTLFIENTDPSLSRSQRQLYKAEFNLTEEEAGIVGIRMPNNAPALQTGQTYLWRLSIACEASSIRDIVQFRGGVIERVPEVTGNADQRLGQYVEQEIWQELLSTIAEDRYAAANDVSIEAEWQNLMQGAGLDNFVDAPIVSIIDASLGE